MANRKIAIVITAKGFTEVERSFQRVTNAQKANTRATKADAAEKRRQEMHVKRLAIANAKLSHAQKGLTNSFIRGNLAARGISMSIAALRDTMRFTTSTLVNFEFAMAKLGAIKRLTSQESDRLEASIRRIAAVSPKTATEVANAALSMAKLGLSADSVAASLKSVIDLSVVLDESVDQVGETITSVKNAFGFDASEINRIVNQMFVGFSESALTLEKFKVAFNFAGTAAKSAGVSFEELVGLMGTLSSRGIRASTIGSQLRSVFLDLSDPSSKASKAIGNMTIKTDGLLPVLRALSEAELANFEIKDKFTKRSVNVVEILAEEADVVEDLTNQVLGNNDALKDGIKILEDTAFVIWKQVVSAFADLAIELVKLEGVKDILRGLRDELNYWRGIATGGSLDFQLSPIEDLEKTIDILEKVEHKRFVLKNLMSSSEAFNDNFKLGIDLQRELKDLEKQLTTLGVRAGNNINGQIKGLKGIIANRKEEARLSQEILDADRAASALLDKKKAEAKRSGLLSKGSNKDTENQLKEDAKWFEWFQDYGTAAMRNQLKDRDEQIKQEKELGKLIGKRAQKRLEEARIAKEATFGYRLMAAELEVLGSAADNVGFALSNNFVNAIIGQKDAMIEFSSVFKSIIISMIAELNKLLIKLAAVATFKAISAAFSFGSAGAAGAGISSDPFFVTPTAVAARGFSGQVNNPTLFMAGEAGAENVTITPSAKTARGGDGASSLTINIGGDVYGKEKFMEGVNEALERIDRRYV